jgi:hypothetical protein
MLPTSTFTEMRRLARDETCYRSVCSLGHRLKDRDQTGVTGTFPTQCHLDGEVSPGEMSPVTWGFEEAKV